MLQTAVLRKSEHQVGSVDHEPVKKEGEEGGGGRRVTGVRVVL